MLQTICSYFLLKSMHMIPGCLCNLLPFTIIIASKSICAALLFIKSSTTYTKGGKLLFNSRRNIYNVKVFSTSFTRLFVVSGLKLQDDVGNMIRLFRKAFTGGDRHRATHVTRLCNTLLQKNYTTKETDV